MLKLHRREHRNKTDHWSKIILSYRHSLSFSELFETWFPLDWLIRYWNYNKLEIFPYKLLTLRIIENFVSIIRFKGVQRSPFSHSPSLLKKITIFAEYNTKTKVITVARLHRYFLLPVTRSFNTLDYWESVENWSGSGWISMERFRT